MFAVHLTESAPTEVSDRNLVTAIDEDLTTTAPTIVEIETAELEDDLFEKPGTDLSEDDESKA